MQKYWDQYYNCDRDNVKFAPTPYEQSGQIEVEANTKKNDNMNEDYITKKKAKVRSFFWAVFGLIVGAAAGIGAFMYLI